MIIGVTGKRGSGKDTVARVLEEKYGFRMLDFTMDVLAPILEREGRPVTRDNLISLAMEGRRKHHNGIWAESIVKMIKKSGAGDFVISGVRFVEEVGVFRKAMGDRFILISVVCDDRKRYERSMRRGTKGEHDMSFGAFMETEKRPTEEAIGKTMEIADFALENNGTLKDLVKEVRKLMETLKR